MSVFILKQNEQFFSYIMGETIYIQWNDDDISSANRTENHDNWCLLYVALNTNNPLLIFHYNIEK